MAAVTAGPGKSNNCFLPFLLFLVMEQNVANDWSGELGVYNVTNLLCILAHILLF